MAHLSEGSKRLEIKKKTIKNDLSLFKLVNGFADVCMLVLPSRGNYDNDFRLQDVDRIVSHVAQSLGNQATLIIIGETIDLIAAHSALSSSPACMRYQLWIAIKRQRVISAGNSKLSEHHFGALVHTKYNFSLRHAKTRIQYSYCPACDKTTKDYGGKKHTYHHYGTLMSDVWRDIACDLEGDLSPIIEKFADLFGIEPYKQLLVYDCRKAAFIKSRVQPAKTDIASSAKKEIRRLPARYQNSLIADDCLTALRKLPDNCIDFAFADPPYNVGKVYSGYNDDLEISAYFEWCDAWIKEMARVLKPGHTLAVLNIPLWSIRHFLFMESILKFQNWIVWDALSFPVRMIMPAHYTILCFTKGKSRKLPGLTGEAGQTDISNISNLSFRSLAPMDERFCLRYQCIIRRRETHLNDRGKLTDLWWDIHRLKHNTRRVDHPCQVPPQLMYRLISLFTKPGELVLDCFNGAGTTTLAAHQLGRSYIGIEFEKKYHEMAVERHEEISRGLDPFRKALRLLTAKNSPVERLPKMKYQVPKKTLQLEVKRVAQVLGRIPSRDDLIKHGEYPIRYYDKYFISWGEVCAAARTTGMKETREPELISR